MDENSASAIAFSTDTALDLLKSPHEFPVSFDEAWRWLGYKTKHKAKQALVNNFAEGVDFICFRRATSGRPSQTLHLTVSCFELLALKPSTAEGQEIRNFFRQGRQLMALSESNMTPKEQLKAKLLDAQTTRSEAELNLAIAEQALFKAQKTLADISREMVAKYGDEYLEELQPDMVEPSPELLLIDTLNQLAVCIDPFQNN